MVDAHGYQYIELYASVDSYRIDHSVARAMCTHIVMRMRATEKKLIDDERQAAYRYTQCTLVEVEPGHI